MAERTTPLVKLNGVAVGRGRTLDFIEGANVDLTVTVDDQEANVTVATSGGSGISTVKADGATVVSSATVLDFASGFDVADGGGGEADVTLDLSEAATGGDLTWVVNAPTIAADAVTFAKFQNITASRLLGRGSAAGSGDMQHITVGAGLSLSGTELSSSAASPTYYSIVKWGRRG